MTVADLICGAVFLPAIGVLASAMSRPKSAEEAPEKKTSSSTTRERIAFRPDLTNEVEVMRERHQVTLVDDREEGTDVTRLPGGVYGFTYSPLQSTPMFRKKATQSFEVHKLPDDSVHLIGFVREGDATRLSASSDQVELRFYPEPWEDAFTAASIPVSRIQSSRGPSRSDGNALWLVVE